jgi:aminopeptidase
VASSASPRSSMSRNGRLGRLADVLVGYSTRVGPDDLVAIEATDAAAPLVLALAERVIGAGGHPYTRIAIEGLEEIRYRESSDAQLDWLNPVRQEEIEHCDVRIAIDGGWNTRSLSRIDPAKLTRVKRAQEPLVRRYLDRAAGGELRWVLTLFPTEASAQDADMSLADYEDFVYAACFLDDERPVERWRAFASELEGVASFLEARSELRVVAEDTDLTLGIGGRTWIPSKGHENFPDGEVFTGPVETSVEGTIRFTYPAVFNRREVEDVRLRFSGGEVVEASAARGQEFLEQMLSMDEGARRVGEFAFGLNDAIDTFSRNILFDEKIGGTVHLALGTSYPETGGQNQSALHWDMICDLRSGGEVYADGELVYRDGRFIPGALG